MPRIPERDLVQIRTRKPSYPIETALHAYLAEYERTATQILAYDDLRTFDDQVPVYTASGSDSLWKTVLYRSPYREELESNLCNIYAILKTEGDTSFLPHLQIDRIDFCEYGNSQPFRIRVVNRLNDNHDYYYVKKADASRVCGLELEHILSPDRINFVVRDTTLIEEHIAGIPGDVFIETMLDGHRRVNPIRVAKEFVKFNERSFAKLLGDMRSYNYVVVLTQDFDAQQYRVRAIDFDRQSHEGELKVYIPQFYAENQPVVEMVWDLLPPETIQQYRVEERTLMRRRAHSARARLDQLFAAMNSQVIAPEDNIQALASQLCRFHRDNSFLAIHTMGGLVRSHLLRTIRATD